MCKIPTRTAIKYYSAPKFLLCPLPNTTLCPQRYLLVFLCLTIEDYLSVFNFVNWDPMLGIFKSVICFSLNIFSWDSSMHTDIGVHCVRRMWCIDLYCGGHMGFSSHWLLLPMILWTLLYVHFGSQVHNLPQVYFFWIKLYGLYMISTYWNLSFSPLSSIISNKCQN